jgi:hypothetical protein
MRRRKSFGMFSVPLGPFRLIVTSGGRVYLKMRVR